jgi:hypothetical protein
VWSCTPTLGPHTRTHTQRQHAGRAAPAALHCGGAGPRHQPAVPGGGRGCDAGARARAVCAGAGVCGRAWRAPRSVWAGHPAASFRHPAASFLLTLWLRGRMQRVVVCHTLHAAAQPTHTHTHARCQRTRSHQPRTTLVGAGRGAGAAGCAVHELRRHLRCAHVVCACVHACVVRCGGGRPQQPQDASWCVRVRPAHTALRTQQQSAHLSAHPLSHRPAELRARASACGRACALLAGADTCHNLKPTHHPTPTTTTHTHTQAR